MKIVCVDNFARENVSDELIAESVPESYAKKIAEWLNEEYSRDNGPIYFSVKPDNYKLHKFEP